MSSKTLLYVVSGLTAAAIVAGALVYGFVLKPKFDQTAPASAPAPQASASPAAAPTPSAMTSAAPMAPKPSSAAAPAAIPTPAFDVVRIEPSGDAVIAGRAAPNAAIVLSDGDKPIGEAGADVAGEFVILPPTLSPGSHSLRLSAKVAGGAPLLSDVYVAEVAGAGVAAKPATSTPTAVAATTQTPAAASPPPMVAAAKPMMAASPAAPAGPASPTASASPAVSANPAALASPTAPASKSSAAPTLAASAVATPSPAASAAGEIVVGRVRAVDPAGLEAEGAAPPGAKVRLRLNDTLLAEAVAGPDGKWSLTIQRGLTPGDYVLEAEIIDAAGARVAHADAPFVYPRREVAAVAPATPQASPSPAVAPAPSPSQVAEPQAAPPPPASPVAVASAPAAPASADAAPEPTPTASLAAPAPMAAALASPAATPVAAATPVVAAPAAAAPAVAAPVASATPSAAPVAAAPGQPAPPTTVAEPTASPPTAQTPAATSANPVIAEVRTFTVVKGDNLWDLARHFYGDGLRYADLYTANSTQIHDPNLIFVGQIFVAPQAAVAK